MIGSSDVPVILRLPHPRSGKPGDLWRTWERAAGLVPRYGGGAADEASARRGRGLEGALIHWFDREHPELYVRPANQEPHPGPEEWMTYTPDAWLWEVAASTGDTPWPQGIVEGKTERSFDARAWGPPPGGAPAYHLAQLIWQLWCARAWQVRQGRDEHLVERGYLVAFATLSEDYREYPVDLDLRVAGGLVDRVRRWYERHVLAGELPEVDYSESCGQTLGRFYRARDGAQVVADADLVQRWHRACRLAATVKELEEELALLKHTIQARMGEAVELVDPDGRSLAHWRARKGASRIDARRLRKERPDIAELYTVTGQDGRSFHLESP